MSYLFLSYSRRDEERVLNVRDRLERLGVRTFIDQVDLPVGDLWSPRLEKALIGAAGFAVFVGAEIKLWQSKEIAVAVNRHSKDPTLPLVPVLLDGGEIDEDQRPFLFQHKSIDMRGSLFEGRRAIDELVGAISHRVPVASAEPGDSRPSRSFDSRGEFRDLLDEVGGEVGAVRADLSSGRVDSSSDAADARAYAIGAIELPFDGVVVTLLDDQYTAIVGGVNGEIAAVDLRSAELLAITVAFDERDLKTPGGGAINYARDRFFFLQRAPIVRGFFTMGFSGVLKTWVYDGSFRQEGFVDLLGPHFKTLHEKIVQAHRSERWSSWRTFYTNAIGAEVPRGIISAKLSPDGSSIICLTEWFAVFRCDLAGRLRDEPVALGDAFAIEPANASGSEVWVGRIYVYSSNDMLYRLDLRTGSVRCVRQSSKFNVVGRGIHTLSPGAICVGGVMLDLPDLALIESSQFSPHSTARPLVLPAKGLVVGVSRSKILVYDRTTLRLEGSQLLAGHAGDVRSFDATRDGAYLVSLAQHSLRVWDLAARTPVGGYPPANTVVRDGLDKLRGFDCKTSTGTVLYRASDQVDEMLVVVDARTKSVSRITCNRGLIGAAGNGSELHVLSIGKREGPPMTGLWGLFQRMSKMPSPEVYALRHAAISAGRLADCASVVLEGGNLMPAGAREPLPQHSLAVDIGNGRLALLTAGHLAIYDSSSRAVVCGPIDIYGADGCDPVSYALWVDSARLAASADTTKLCVRGPGRAIRVFSTVNLAPLAEIRSGEGMFDVFIFWTDSRYVLFAADVGISLVKRELRIADCTTGTVLGKLCDLRGYALQEQNAAVLLRHGSVLAIAEANSIAAIDLVTGEYLSEPLASHSDTIDAVYLSPDRDEIVTVSQDGTVGFWSYGSRVDDSPARAAMVRNRVLQG